VCRRRRPRAQKKKKPKEPEPEGDDDDDDEEGFAVRRTGEDDDDDDDDDDGDDDGGDDDGEGGFVSIPKDREYKYEELLDRMYSLLIANNPELAGDRRKFLMKPPQVVREGSKRVVFINFGDICKSMNRSQDHVYSFMLSEMGTTGSIDASSRMVIKGRFPPKAIEQIIRRRAARAHARREAGSLSGSLTRPAPRHAHAPRPPAAQVRRRVRDVLLLQVARHGDAEAEPPVLHAVQQLRRAALRRAHQDRLRRHRQGRAPEGASVGARGWGRFSCLLPIRIQTRGGRPWLRLRHLLHSYHMCAAAREFPHRQPPTTPGPALR
jgi:hypothetical protein